LGTGAFPVKLHRYLEFIHNNFLLITFSHLLGAIFTSVIPVFTSSSAALPSSYSKLCFVINNVDPLAKRLANETGKDSFSSDLVDGKTKAKSFIHFEVAKVYLLLQFMSKKIANYACLKVCMCAYTYAHTYITPSIQFSFSFMYM